MPASPTAQDVAAALEAGANLKDLADALYAELAAAGHTGAVSINLAPRKPHLDLVALPGYGPLSDPTAFLHLATVVP